MSPLQTSAMIDVVGELPTFVVTTKSRSQSARPADLTFTRRHVTLYSRSKFAACLISFDLSVLQQVGVQKLRTLNT
jgi:hypothetical protein